VGPDSTISAGKTHPELTDFPTDEHHVKGQLQTINLGRLTPPVDVAPLAAQYDLFQVIDDNIREIHIDLLGVNGADFADLDAVAQIGEGGTWKRFKGVNGRLVFCRDKADQNVSGVLEVVIANHVVARDLDYPDLPDKDVHAKGTYLIQATEEQTSECNPNFVVLHGKLTGDRDEFAQTTHASFEFYIKWKRPNDWRDTLNMTFMSGSFSFQSDVHGVCGGSRSGGGNFQAPDGPHAAVLRERRHPHGQCRPRRPAAGLWPNSHHFLGRLRDAQRRSTLPAARPRRHQHVPADLDAGYERRRGASSRGQLHRHPEHHHLDGHARAGAADDALGRPWSERATATVGRCDVARHRAQLAWGDGRADRVANA
jgi:hypothetical protein